MISTLDFRDFLLRTIGEDGQFQTLTGATVEDPRIYWYYQGDARVSDTQPVFVTYTLMTMAEKFRATREPTASFIIWGRYIEAVEAVVVRLATLLDQQLHTTPQGDLVYTKQIAQSDSFQQQPDFAGIQMQFRIGVLDLV